MERQHRCLLLSVAAVLACSAPATEPPPSPPASSGLRILTGDNQTDSVASQLSQPVVLELRGADGSLLRGKTVSLTAQAPDRTDCGFVSCDRLYFQKGQDAFRSLLDSTDSQGRLAVHIITGGEAGVAELQASAPDFGYTVTAHVTVTAGNAVGILARPRDSAAYVGFGYTLDAALVDRYHNHRPDVVSYSTASPAVTVNGSGRIQASAIGRGLIVLHAGGFTDTALITVPPRGTLAAYNFGPSFGDLTGIVKVELDGSGYRMLASVPPFPDNGVSPSWSATGNAVLYHSGQLTQERLYLVDTTGGTPQLVFPNGPTTLELWGQVSTNRQWIYYVGRNPASACSWLWRSHPDATAAGLVAGPPDCSLSVSQMSPSPDGSQAVFVSDRDGLTLVDQASGRLTPLGVKGIGGAVWSPDGSLIAYVVNFELTVLHPDGSGQRALAPVDAGGIARLERPAWSPDNNWLVYRSDGHLKIVNLQTGQTLPLGWSGALVQPAWHPAP